MGGMGLKTFVIEIQAGKFLAWDQRSRTDWMGEKWLAMRLILHSLVIWKSEEKSGTLCSCKLENGEEKWFWLLGFYSIGATSKDILQHYLKIIFQQSKYKPLEFLGNKPSNTGECLSWVGVCLHPCNLDASLSSPFSMPGGSDHSIPSSSRKIASESCLFAVALDSVSNWLPERQQHGMGADTGSGYSCVWINPALITISSFSFFPFVIGSFWG